MLASYTFNSQYQAGGFQDPKMPNLRLLEGGKFSPNEFSPVLIKEDERISLRFFKWGMQPNWPKRISGTQRQFIAPADYLFRHPSFRQPILRNRCLIPADGFYLKREQDNTERTFKVSQSELSTFCFAGIYESWVQEDGTTLCAFSIISTPSSDSMKRFGLQMPLILAKHDERIWLNPKANLNKISQLLYTPSRTRLQIHPVEELQEYNWPAYQEQLAA